MLKHLISFILFVGWVWANTMGRESPVHPDVDERIEVIAASADEGGRRDAPDAAGALTTLREAPVPWQSRQIFHYDEIKRCLHGGDRFDGNAEALKRLLEEIKTNKREIERVLEFIFYGEFSLERIERDTQRRIDELEARLSTKVRAKLMMRKQQTDDSRELTEAIVNLQTKHQSLRNMQRRQGIIEWLKTGPGEFSLLLNNGEGASVSQISALLETLSESLAQLIEGILNLHNLKPLPPDIMSFTSTLSKWLSETIQTSLLFSDTLFNFNPPREERDAECTLENMHRWVKARRRAG